MKLEKLGDWRRTHTCGELRKGHVGKMVTLMGWVDRRRDHGGLIFVDIRDRYGRSQIVFNPKTNQSVYEKAKELRPEFVIAVRGIVSERPPESLNPKLATGEVELRAGALKILNVSKTPPFQMIADLDVSEELRLKYRYLDLRRPKVQKNILLRHKVAQIVRRYFDEQDFIEIETPYLMKSTPEGARDFLVPSRLHKGKFFALPQSPQTYKQILMVAGYDRYFQIVRCFRDEDLRADRQPEFTQIDVEMSFVQEEAIFLIIEGLMEAVFKAILGESLPRPFLRLSYGDALRRFGVDKPDLRFGMEIQTVTHLLGETEFEVFNSVRAAGGNIAGIAVPDGGKYSRSQLTEFNKYALSFGAKGTLPLKVERGALKGQAAKFLRPEIQSQIIELFQAKEGDLILLIAGLDDVVYRSLGALRLYFGEKLNLIDTSVHKLVWVVDFPLLEFDPDQGRYVAMHHPFTSPKEEDFELMEAEPSKIRARAYDLVLDGNEIAGGSIRIHRKDIQMKMFRLLGISPEEAEKKFGFLLHAFEYGAPPHGGIAFGFDRLVMILAGEKSIREVIPFPKTTSAISLMDGAPAEVDQEQLKELGIRVVETEDSPPGERKK
ncbi:aspartate--tRNA ligase [bacterium BMS3Bbin03]|nr:aspartate--tRNA ligase [bacterium BMS3Bbin03]